MTWLVWRRQRIPLLAALSLVAVLVAVAVVGRLVTLGTADALGLTPCLSGAAAAICRSQLWTDHFVGHTIFQSQLGLAAVAVPGLAGALVGATLFGTELARGTHVFALTQAVPRLRWWGTGLLVSGAPVAVAVALATPVVGWSTGPLDTVNVSNPIAPLAFLTTGVVPAAYTVLAFCLAATAGLLLRNTVGALGLALVVQVGVLAATTLVLRPDYLPPETVRVALLPPGQGDVVWASPPDALGVDYGYVDTEGREVSQRDARLTDCQVIVSFSDCLRADGYTALYSRYQPASRYWPFQTIEAGLVLGLAAGALGIGLLRLRRLR